MPVAGSDRRPAARRLARSIRRFGPTRMCDHAERDRHPVLGHQLNPGRHPARGGCRRRGIPGSGPVAIIANLTAVECSQPTLPHRVPGRREPEAERLGPQRETRALRCPNLVVVGPGVGGTTSVTSTSSTRWAPSTPRSTSTAGSSDHDWHPRPMPTADANRESESSQILTA